MLDQEEESEGNELEKLLFSEMQNDDVESNNDNEGIDDIIGEDEINMTDDIQDIQ
jgi:hypothetical protein